MRSEFFSHLSMVYVKEASFVLRDTGFFFFSWVYIERGKSGLGPVYVAIFRSSTVADFSVFC